MIVIPDKRNSRLDKFGRRVPFFGGTPSEPAIVAPTSLTATATSSTTADLAWSWSGDEADIDGFSIERQLSSGGTWSEITTVGAAAREYEDTSLTADTEYDWRVRAFVTGPPEEFSAYSNVDSATTATEPLRVTYDTTLVSGTNIVLSLDGDVDVEIDWGDGFSEPATTPGTVSHTYDAEGTYTVEISGSLTVYGGSNFGSGPDFTISNRRITEVISFGDLGLTDISFALNGAQSVTSVPSSIPETITTLEATLSGTDLLDQDISTWSIPNVTTAASMLSGDSFSTANYDALLIGWEGQRPNIQSNVGFSGGNSTYTAGGAAETARSNLINDFGWTITDGGSV